MPGQSQGDSHLIRNRAGTGTLTARAIVVGLALVLLAGTLVPPAPASGSGPAKPERTGAGPWPPGADAPLPPGTYRHARGTMVGSGATHC